MISKVAKATVADDCKIPALQLLLNVLERPEVQEQLVSSGGIPAFIRLLKSSENFVVQLSATVSVLFESSWRQLRRAALRHDKRSILGRIELHVEVLDRLVTCGIHGDLRLVVLPRSSFCQCVH